MVFIYSDEIIKMLCSANRFEHAIRRLGKLFKRRDYVESQRNFSLQPLQPVVKQSRLLFRWSRRPHFSKLIPLVT